MPGRLLPLAVAAEGGLLVLALALGWWWEVPALGRLVWTWGAVAAGLAATAPLLVGLRWCLRTRWPPMRRLIAEVDERIRPLFAGAGPASLALVALLAGVGEEALFRGVLQEALGRLVPAWASLILVSALFGLVHWVTSTYALLAGIVGLYLGALYLVTGNLLAPIVTHAAYDLVALLVLTRVKPAPSPSVV